MKKYLLLLIIATTGLSVKAQTNVYYPFPDSNAVWIYSYYAGCPGGPNGSCGYLYYKLNGDTVIGSYTYKQIWGTGLNLSTYSYSAAIREDTIARKVYCIGVCGNTDTLLFDFNVKAGDTLKQCGFCNSSDSGLVKSVDSVLVSGYWRKRINNIGGNYIEGIGGYSGVFCIWSETLEGFFGLVCFSVNGVSLYPDTTCMLTGINELNDNTKIDIEVFPNPMIQSGSIRFNTEYSSNVKINLYDLSLGITKNIFSGNLNSGNNNIQIDAHALSSGLYVLQFVENKNVYVGNKLIEIIH